MVLATSVDTHPKDGVDTNQKLTPERLASALILLFQNHLTAVLSIFACDDAAWVKFLVMIMPLYSGPKFKSIQKLQQIVLTSKSFTLILAYLYPLTLKIEQMPI